MKKDVSACPSAEELQGHPWIRQNAVRRPEFEELNGGIGAKMMAKWGWKPWRGLGRNGEGPVEVPKETQCEMEPEIRRAAAKQKLGLGCDTEALSTWNGLCWVHSSRTAKREEVWPPAAHC